MSLRATVTKLIAHFMSLKNQCAWCLCAFLLTVLPFPCFGQELEPRRWSHLPMDMNFIGVGYSYTEANIFFEPVLQIENAKMKLHTWGVKYIRTFELFQKSSRIDFIQGYQEGHWAGLLSGVPASVTRRGLSDSLLRFAVNLYGAPPLKGKEFESYLAKTHIETIFGTALVVQLPTGEYMADKFINLGTNRFTFRPQVGVVHNRGKWSMELTGAIWLYTDNNDFYNGSKLEQDPLFTLQTSLVYNFLPGLWAAGSVGYGHGGESILEGVPQNDRRENLAWAFSFGYPITRRLGLKIVYLGTRTQRQIGEDTDSISANFSVFW
jgi:hypothetical protein